MLFTASSGFPQFPAIDGFLVFPSVRVRVTVIVRVREALSYEALSYEALIAMAPKAMAALSYDGHESPSNA